MPAGSIQVRLPGILIIGVVFLIAGSGGGAASTSAQAQSVSGGIALTVNPGSTRISSSDTLSITATVTGTTDTSVTWSVDGFQDGNATVGTLAGSGSTVCTTPAAAGAHTVTATSNADFSKKASAVITTQAGVLVTVAPGSASLTRAATLTLTAMVSGATNPAGTWMVDGVSNGNTSVLYGSGEPRLRPQGLPSPCSASSASVFSNCAPNTSCTDSSGRRRDSFASLPPGFSLPVPIGNPRSTRAGFRG